MEDRSHRPAGLASFDGTSWVEVSPFAGDDHLAVVDFDVGADDSVWAWLVPDGDVSREHIARWDGETWGAWTWPSWLEGHPDSYHDTLTAAPDGRVWFREPLMFLDCQAWTLLHKPAVRNTTSIDVGWPAFAPDDSVWMTARGNRGGGIFRLDLDEVEPLAVEPARPYDPVS